MNFIKGRLRSYLNEISNQNNIWYHGTPDVRDLEKDGGFTNKTISVEYVKDIKSFNEWQEELSRLRTNDEKAYFELLKKADIFKDRLTIRKPIFLTDKYEVAKSYADPRRSLDYQNAMEKVLKVKCDDGNNVTISAHGERFRFIEVSRVKEGFIRAGINPERFDETVNKFIFSQQDKTKIKTDVIAVLGEVFNFDTIDVLGVLDSYEGGSIKSIVRMVFDPSMIKIIQ